MGVSRRRQYSYHANWAYRRWSNWNSDGHNQQYSRIAPGLSSLHGAFKSHRLYYVPTKCVLKHCTMENFESHITYYSNICFKHLVVGQAEPGGGVDLDSFPLSPVSEETCHENGMMRWMV
jgi:hypothetical protein